MSQRRYSLRSQCRHQGQCSCAAPQPLISTRRSSRRSKGVNESVSLLTSQQEDVNVTFSSTNATATASTSQLHSELYVDVGIEPDTEFNTSRISENSRYSESESFASEQQNVYSSSSSASISVANHTNKLRNSVGSVSFSDASDFDLDSDYSSGESYLSERKLRGILVNSSANAGEGTGNGRIGRSGKGRNVTFGIVTSTPLSAFPLGKGRKVFGEMEISDLRLEEETLGAEQKNTNIMNRNQEEDEEVIHMRTRRRLRREVTETRVGGVATTYAYQEQEEDYFSDDDGGGSGRGEGTFFSSAANSFTSSVSFYLWRFWSFLSSILKAPLFLVYWVLVNFLVSEKWFLEGTAGRGGGGGSRRTWGEYSRRSASVFEIVWNKFKSVMGGVVSSLGFGGKGEAPFPAQQQQMEDMFSDDEGTATTATATITSPVQQRERDRESLHFRHRERVHGNGNGYGFGFGSGTAGTNGNGHNHQGLSTSTTGVSYSYLGTVKEWGKKLLVFWQAEGAEGVNVNLNGYVGNAGGGWTSVSRSSHSHTHATTRNFNQNHVSTRSSRSSSVGARGVGLRQHGFDSDEEDDGAGAVVVDKWTLGRICRVMWKWVMLLGLLGLFFWLLYTTWPYLSSIGFETAEKVGSVGKSLGSGVYGFFANGFGNMAVFFSGLSLPSISLPVMFSKNRGLDVVLDTATASPPPVPVITPAPSQSDRSNYIGGIDVVRKEEYDALLRRMQHLEAQLAAQQTPAIGKEDYAALQLKIRALEIELAAQRGEPAISKEDYEALQVKLRTLETELTAHQEPVVSKESYDALLDRLRKLEFELAAQKEEIERPRNFDAEIAQVKDEVLSDSELNAKLDAQLQACCEKNKCPCPECPSPSGLPTRPSGGINEEIVNKMINTAIRKYDADKTGLPDLALESAGGSIVSTRCTESSKLRGSVVSLWGFKIWSPPNNPRTIIQPGVVPGECWAFVGSIGYVVIKIVGPAVITGFTMEHIPKAISPYGKIDSAPREFQVLGLNDENDLDNAFDYGNFTYEDNGEPIQYFDVQKSTDTAYPIVELKILSNHGNIHHTCLYRFRVHGLLQFNRPFTTTVQLESPSSDEENTQAEV